MKLITPLILIIFTLLILIPPVVHGYVYPSKGDDAAVHIALIDSMGPETLPKVDYLGQLVVGVPIAFSVDVMGFEGDAVYLWWSYGMLVLAGLTVWYVVRKLVNGIAGLLAMMMMVFMGQGLLYLFNYGQMFSIVNMLVILPVGMLFLVRWMTKTGHQWENYLIALGMFSLFAVFHKSGAYLPWAMMIFLLGYCARTAYYLLRRQHAINSGNSLTLVTLVVGIFVIIGAGFLFTGIGTPSSSQPLSTLYVGPDLYTVDNAGVNIPTFMVSVVGLVALMLGVIAVVVITQLRMDIGRSAWLLLGLLGAFSVVLAIGAWVPDISPDPSRQVMDLGSLVMVMVAIVVGVGLAMVKRGRVLVTGIVVVMVAVVAIPNMVNWVGYNSAVSKADVLAMEWLNEQYDSEQYANRIHSWEWELPTGTFATTTEVAPWIYDRFLNKEYVEGDADFVIWRSEPMTPRCDPENVFYKDRIAVSVEGLPKLASFAYEGVEVIVYEGGRVD